MKRINYLFLFFLAAAAIFPQQKFKTGVYANWPSDVTQRQNLWQIKHMGANSVIHHSRDDSWHSKDSLEIYEFDDVIIFNAYSEQDYIHHYSAGYYTRWEAETEVSINENTPGIKHAFGTNGGTHWESGTNSNFIGQYLVTGPDYRQDWQYKFYYNTDPIKYIVRFNMKIDGDTTSLESVCEISVKYRTANGDVTTLRNKTLTARDLSHSFKQDTLHYIIPEKINGTPTEIITGTISGGFNKYREAPNELPYTGPYGVQFDVKWLGHRNLYVDYIEVYDDYVWKYYLENTQDVIDQIKSYADSLKTNNTKYWYSLDEPHSIDNYEPYKVVNSILDSNGHAPLITAFYPNWNGKRNNEWTITRFMETVKPARLMYDYYPYFYNWNGVNYTDEYCLELQRELMQQPFTITNGIPSIGDYYYVAQAFGWEPWCENDARYQSRKPNPSQLRATVMLALAHGTKGIFFWPYYSYLTDYVVCNNPPPIQLLTNAIVDLNNEPTDIYYEIKNNLFARLNNILGITLVTMNYTGEFVRYRNGILENTSNNYLSLFDPQIDPDINFHGGLLESKVDAEEKYFLLANLVTDNYRNCGIEVLNTSGYNNLRLLEVEEGSIDETVTTSFIGVVGLEAGDGKLFQVAPVVKYGGKLINDEHITQPTTLNDDMTIENGATLFINNTYTAKANITVKTGGKIVGENNGLIVFTNSHKLFIEGSGRISGTENNRLSLAFPNSHGEGIRIKSDASLTMTYCNVSDARYGIVSETGVRTVSFENVNVSNCPEYGIMLTGSLENWGERTPTIKNCTFINCGFAVSAANFQEFVIHDNTINDSGLGVFVSQIPSTYIIKNRISKSREPILPGIFMHTSNGNIRGNTVSGHTEGIYLANSSPDIGDNTLERNSEHGIYIGDGSIPNLVAHIAGAPPVFWAISGYNIIGENGNSIYRPIEGDGSEIYISKSDIRLGSGCNQIVDDREPLYENRLLMNGYLSEDRTLDASYNYWGRIELSPERFGELSVNYDPFIPIPYSGPCTMPQSGCSELFTRTSRGEMIDEISAKNCDPRQLSQLELKYAEADMLYLTGEVNEAKTAYQQITDGQYSPEEKLYAYNKLYTIGNLIDTTDNYFTNLQTIFNNLAQTVTDSTLMDIFTQNSILCKVSKEEYASAIVDYDNIIQQNPESEKAVYAEMDILTTALLMDTTNNQLGKVAGGKYLVKGSDDYLTKLSGIMKKSFGKGSKEKANLIPTEFALSQNYPNPFNPSTKIKYQLPNNAQVSLRIYDILGKVVATLVNEEKPAGYYEVSFNASNLSSGIYFYRIVTKDFVKTRKMMVVK